MAAPGPAGTGSSVALPHPSSWRLTGASVRISGPAARRWPDADMGRSGFDDHRNDHRAAPVGVADPAANGAAHELAKLMHLGDALAGRLLQRRLNEWPHFGESRIVDARPARVNLRARDQLAARGDDDNDHRDEALLAEDEAILKRRLGDLAHREAVDVDVAARHHAGDGDLTADQVHHDAVLSDHDVPPRHAGQRG